MAKTKPKLKSWQSTYSPDLSGVARVPLRGGNGGSRPLALGPLQSTGWYPRIAPDGKAIAFGFWVCKIVDFADMIERDIQAPTGARLQPLGFIDNRTLIACTETGPAAVYSISLNDYIPRDLGVPSELVPMSFGNAWKGHWAIDNATQSHVVKDGKVFLPHTERQYGVSVAGDYLATAARDRGYEIMQFHGEQKIRELPSDNLWVMNEQGDVVTGYYGRVKLYRIDGPFVDATIAPWGTEGVACPVRLGSDLWLWSPTCGGSTDECWTIGRRLGEVDPIVLPIPSVSCAAVWDGTQWVVAGNDDKGRLKVMWVPMDTPRTKLVPKAPPVDPPQPPPVDPPPPEPVMTYREFSAYFAQRWNELGVPEATAEVTRRMKVTSRERVKLRGMAVQRRIAEGGNNYARRTLSTISKRIETLEQAYKSVQCPAVMQIAGELHHDRGNRDVGLSTKNGGTRWTLKDGRTVADDIITIKPTDGAGNVVSGNFTLVDAVVSIGSADARPTWSVLGPNTDSSRPWALPPVPERAEPEPKPIERHVYQPARSGEGPCLKCGQPADDMEMHFEQEQPPMEKHEFKPWARKPTLCESCGEEQGHEIHQMPSAPGGTVNLAPVLLKLDEIIANQKAQTAATNSLRTGVVEAINDAAKFLPSIFKKAK
jgi:hypothetical protein